MIGRKKGKAEDKVTHVFPLVGSLEILPWYADNTIYCQELRLALSPHDWYELENQPFFHDLIQYLRKKGIQENTYLPL